MLLDLEGQKGSVLQILLILLILLTRTRTWIKPRGEGFMQPRVGGEGLGLDWFDIERRLIFDLVLKLDTGYWIVIAN